MTYKLENLFGYRFFEKKEGPLVTIRKYTKKEVDEIGKRAGITNIQEIYDNRVIIENWLYRQFVKKGGQPQIKIPYYAAVYDELPADNQLHVRFQEPQCIRIPMSAFPKNCVSFTYGQSPRALTRKDNHPTRRKILTWEEAEWAINKFPYDHNEGTWLEMQIWEESTIQHFYNNKNNLYVKDFNVSQRMSEATKQMVYMKYFPYIRMLPSRLFFDADSVHGVMHTLRVFVLADKLAEDQKLDIQLKSILQCSALYHDIGRNNDQIDDFHGYRSYEEIRKFGIVLQKFPFKLQEIMRFVIENHPFDDQKAVENIKKYSLGDSERIEAMKVLHILKDADTLDRCRFGHINLDYLTLEDSRKYVSFAYQLLTIFREKI